MKPTRSTTYLATAALSLVALFVASSPSGALASELDKEPGKGEKLFALKVKPLLSEKCLACHGGEEKIKGDLDIRTRASMLLGGETFGKEVLIPGDGESSFLYLTALRAEPDFEMPPKEADKLSEEEAWALRDWINAGAPWPDDDRVAWIQEKYAEGVMVETSGGLSEDWTNRRYKPEDLWAYQPVNAPELPADLKEHPIDALLAARIEEAGVAPAPLAEPRLLIRRVSYGLTGLPPKPEEIDAFLAAWEREPEEAWSQLIDRLLDSPHYGEQWGQHWLDVVRYADSAGFANDYERPNTWRYRDYVIRAFNQDKPYDQFIREQIAGDEIDDGNPENLIATGFLRMGPWEHTGMSVAKVTRQQFLDDVTDSVGQVFLAHAMQCARCHDHKFDPVPTRDYYAMQAAFSTTQFADRDADWLPGENRALFEVDRHYHDLRTKSNDAMLKRLQQARSANEKAWFAERGLPYKSRSEALKAKAPEEQIPPRSVGFTPDEFGSERVGRKHQNRFKWEYDRYKPIAFSVYSGKTNLPKASYGKAQMPDKPMDKGHVENTTILNGGDVFSPGEPVSPGVLSAVPSLGSAELPSSPKGRREALANWIADPDNALTARVMVNRIWAQHFGRGIAGNPNNFGATGKKPTHPELLDYLAEAFVESGWSVKAMHRLILESKAYRRDTRHPDSEELTDKDPHGETYAVFRPRRLSAEELRDSMLACSGELNPELGGIPARPDMNLEAALQPRMIMGTFAPAYVPHPKPEQRNRRSIYAHKTRGQRDPFLDTFNKPGSETSCELRETSTVTPQVFALFNSEESYDRSLALAHRALERSSDRRDALRWIFLTCFGRPPADDELQECLAHWRQMEAAQAELELEPKTYPTEVVRRAQEENTGQNFTFTEKLFVYEDYVPDLQPHEVPLATRALADLCLVIFNSNEFVYLY